MSNLTPVESINCVLALDPGTSKCGLAVVRRCPGGAAPEAVYMSVVSASEAEAVMRDLVRQYSVDLILIGNGTMCEEYCSMAEKLAAAPVQVINEKFSTLRARQRYFRHNPPRGLRRLIPISLQTPPQPYDDYVAVILAESFLSAN